MAPKERAAAKRSSSEGSQSKRSAPSSKKTDAVSMLRADHADVKALFLAFDKLKSDGPRKASIVNQICDALTIHARLEEEVFYPAVRSVVRDDALMDEADVEHQGAKALIDQLREMSPGDDLYDAKVTVLKEYIEHHVKEEQSEMFPKVKASKLDLVKLGAELEQARANWRA